MNQGHKFNFFEQIAYAVARPMQYYRLTKVNSSRLTVFIFLLLLITSIVSAVQISYNLFGPTGLSRYLREDIPEFDLTDGLLYVSERIEDINNNSYVLVDTDIYEFTTADIDESYDQVILISQTNLIIYRPYGRIQAVRFNNLEGLHLDNSIIGNILPFIYLIVALGIIISYIFKVIIYCISALFYSLAGLIVSAASRANLTYSTIFKTAIYSKVPVCLLFTILDLTPITVAGLTRTGVSLLITCLYVVFGIISHTSKEAYTEAGIIPPRY